MKRHTILKKLLIFFTTLLMVASTAHADTYQEVQSIVFQSEHILQDFSTDPKYSGLKRHFSAAKAIFIIPQMLKGGFLIGGSGGTGVLVSRDMKTGEWSYPVFYNMGSVSIGLQVGAESSQLVLLVMTEKGMRSLLSTSFKLGADATIAAGTLGAGAKITTADIISFAKSKGAFGGATVEGAIVEPKESWNYIYYQQPASIIDILYNHKYTNPDADSFRSLVKSISTPQRQKIQY